MMNRICLYQNTDMQQEAHKETVLDIMKKEALKDYSRMNVVGWTRLGLL
jgi:hypothetical protein